MIKEKFKSYSREDFIMDEDFREIVRSSGYSNDLNELLAALPEKKEEINLAVTILRGMHQNQICQQEERKVELWNEIVQSQTRKIYLIPYLKIAAAILLLIGIGSSIFYYRNIPNNPGEVAIINNPSPNDAMLILANGKKVSISSKESTVKVSPDGSGITVNDSAGIAQPDVDEGMHQLVVPYGKRSRLTLADGTCVWVNSGSRLSFPQSFKGERREVILEGEALFNVKKDDTKPFFVKTDAFLIKVYGTKFNVNAYSNEGECNIVLVNGKISMNSTYNLNADEIFLSPSQKATLTKGERDFRIQNIENTDIYTAWVEGYLVFANEEVRDVLHRVSRYYNVPIQCDLPDIEKIYGKLDLKDDIDRVLEGIAFISKSDYTKQGDKYLFFNKLTNK